MLLVETLQHQAPPQQINNSKKIIDAQKTNVEQNPNISNEDFGEDNLDSDLDGEESEVIDALPPDLQEIKRYYLIQKINMLKTRLSEYNINNEDLDIVVKFINELSYNSLILLSNSIIQSVEDQIVRLANEQK